MFPSSLYHLLLICNMLEQNELRREINFNNKFQIITYSSSSSSSSSSLSDATSESPIKKTMSNDTLSNNMENEDSVSIKIYN